MKLLKSVYTLTYARKKKSLITEQQRSRGVLNGSVCAAELFISLSLRFVQGYKGYEGYKQRLHFEAQLYVISETFRWRSGSAFP